MMSLLHSALITGFLLAITAASQAQVILDSYGSGPFTATGPFSAILVNGDPAQLVGGTREVTISSENNPILPFSTASLELGEGYLEYHRQQNSYFYLSYGSYATPDYAFTM
jgi:hypothetical protein